MKCSVQLQGAREGRRRSREEGEQAVFYAASVGYGRRKMKKAGGVVSSPIGLKLCRFYAPAERSDAGLSKPAINVF